MKKWLKKFLIGIGIIVLVFLIDLYCIFTINRPIFAIKGNLPNQYLGLLYDTYTCPEYSVPQITSKGTKFVCSMVIQEEEKIESEFEIIDTSRNRTDLAFAQALEKFYEDDNYEYYFNYIKSSYIIVKYEDGREEGIKEALKSGNINISDLDTFRIGYFKYRK